MMLATGGLWVTLLSPTGGIPDPAQEQAARPALRARDASVALEQGVAFLLGDVPRWNQEHGCFSCHHNGDGARALFAARAAGFSVPEEALSTTLAWLAAPSGWDESGEDAPFRDTFLARLQFAAALRDGVAQGVVSGVAMQKASEVLVELQAEDGSWPVNTGGAPGSPITWGSTLATAQAWEVLRNQAEEAQAGAVARAAGWLRSQRPQRVMDAAALLTALARMEPGDAVEAARVHCRKVLAKAAPSGGGFGPFQGSPPEVFDTALVMLALAPHANVTDIAITLQSARRYLILQQDLDGSWPPTTRPSGADSEAHRLSTTAWAVLALLRVDAVLGKD